MEKEQERLREAIVYYQEFRSQMLGDLNGYQSGTHYTGEIRHDQRADTTPHTIAELKRRIAKTENLIAAYQALLNA